MKKTFLLITLICLATTPMHLFAKQAGIYMTVSDYKAQKLSYTTDTKIRMNNSVAVLPYVTVIEKNKTTKLNKSEVYGYADKNENAYRFYEGKEYLIAEAGTITIYSHTERIGEIREHQSEKRYYFSLSPDGEIYSLTLGNVNHAYRNNDKVLDALEQFFSNGGDITAYDKIHTSYKINYVLAKAMK